MVQLTDEDKFFQRKEVQDLLLSRNKGGVTTEGLKVDFPLNEYQMFKLLKICQEPSFQVPSGLTRKERRQWALDRIAQEDVMNELVSLSEDLELYDTNSVTVVSDSNLMTVEKGEAVEYAELFLNEGEND